ncbi:adenosylmethionine--8-amino-7-oxononanoate transaminase [Desulfosarcina sp. OttesenSCG-928-G10]|nr:adenosylmethionine--8-amino-7-oxononanoate transaminase [Desulfosarcina sp. OttesenSCG-928-G10]
MENSLHQDDDLNLLEFDRKHLWHPYTSAVNPLPVFEAVSTSAQHIDLRSGTRLVDGMASWWAAIHGYNHPRLEQALLRQAKQMPHVMFGGLTHAPAVRLGKKLLEIAPEGLNRIFFADSGSVAVEVALKMAVQYHQATGKPDKTACMTFSGGYHGDTLGAMSVCDPISGMHTLFQRILPKQIFVDKPRCAFDAVWHSDAAASLENCFNAYAPSTAAFILEPIVQGAGGMWFYHPEYLRKIKALCHAHDVLLIADEIATGFGRTGKMFACEWGAVQPDILCVGKALTGGVMSLAATLATDKVARGISQDGGVLMHGPTFMANPLACAVAHESLELLTEGRWKKDVPRIEALLRERLNPCRGLPGVADVRILGAIGVLEMDGPVNVEPLQQYFVNTWKVWIRPFGRLMYVMPPYVSRDEDIAVLTAAMRGAVEDGLWK